MDGRFCWVQYGEKCRPELVVCSVNECAMRPEKEVRLKHALLHTNTLQLFRSNITHYSYAFLHKIL